MGLGFPGPGLLSAASVGLGFDWLAVSRRCRARGVVGGHAIILACRVLRLIAEPVGLHVFSATAFFPSKGSAHKRVTDELLRFAIPERSRALASPPY